MDRNSIIGLVLIGAVLIGYSYFTKPSEEELKELQRRKDSVEQVQQRQILEEQKIKEAAQLQRQQMETADSAEAVKEAESKYGDFASAVNGDEQFIVLENKLVKITIANKGGRIYSVELKDYKTYNGDPLMLFDGDNNYFGLNFFAQNRNIATNDLYFEYQGSQTILNAEGGAKKVVMRLNAGNDRYLEYEYILEPESYMVDFNLNMSGMNELMATNIPYLDLKWDMDVPHMEKGRTNEANYTTIAYKYYQDDVEEMMARGKEDNEEEIRTKLEWVAFKHQFFSSILIAKENFGDSYLKFNKYDEGEYVRNFHADIAVPVSFQQNETIPMAFYFGPNHYTTLKTYEKGFEELVPLGRSVIALVNKGIVIPVFNFLSKYISNYGIIILLLTIFIKIIILPLTFKSYTSSAKMRVLKPQVDEINKKYPKKEDAMKKQQAVMALYKQVGVSPLGGCLPIAIQFPVLIALFRFFPAAIELRQKSFLWADDLSTYDAIVSWSTNIPFISNIYGNHISLFTILMAGALILSTRLNSAQMADANAQMPGMKFMMNVMMPVMMIFWFNNYAAGLSYYYFLSNLITIGQTYLIRSFVDDQAILKKLEANKKKPAKKSKWQQRLEEAAKQRGYQAPKK